MHGLTGRQAGTQLTHQCSTTNRLAQHRPEQAGDAKPAQQCKCSNTWTVSSLLAFFAGRGKRLPVKGVRALLRVCCACACAPHLHTRVGGRFHHHQACLARDNGSLHRTAQHNAAGYSITTGTVLAQAGPERGRATETQAQCHKLAAGLLPQFSDPTLTMQTALSANRALCLL